MPRKRSQQAHEKVLRAALKLFTERGIEATSMDAVAETSGVSKATIYKHWADKDALALEALALLFGLKEQPPTFDSGDLRKDFVDALTYEPGTERQEVRNAILPHVMAYAARNREFGDQWRSRVLGAPQLRLRKLIQRGIAKRKLTSGIDINAALALLLGPMFYWHILVGRKLGVPAPRSLAEQVVGVFLKAFSTRGARRNLQPYPTGRTQFQGTERDPFSPLQDSRRS